MTPNCYQKHSKSGYHVGQKSPQTFIYQLLRNKQVFRTRTALFVRIKEERGEAKQINLAEEANDVTR